MEPTQLFPEQALLNEARLEALLKLSQMTEAPLQEITDFSLEQAVLLTKSRIGYLAFMNEAETVLTMHSWSKSAMKECEIADKPLTYPVETTGLWGEAVRQRKPIVTNNYNAPNPLKKGLPEGHVGLSRHMNVPTFDGGHIVIVAGVGDKEAEYDESDVRQLTLLMEGMWTLLQRQRVQAELRRHRDHLEQLVQERTAEVLQANENLNREWQSLKHLLQSSDHERQLIAYEIHDGLAQYLAGSMMQFEVFSHLKETSPKEAAKAFNAGIALLRQSHLDARRLISGVRPLTLDEEGVTAAISDLVNEHQRRGGPKIEFHKDVRFDRLEPILENAIYRIVQEGLANACSHSKSERIRVELVQQGDRMRLVVQDWGVGFDPEAVAQNRFGLAGMRERARLLGGTIKVESTPGEGTCITAELPLVGKG